MGIVQRIWSREVAPPSLELSLAERLKQLAEQAQPESPAKEACEPDSSAEAASPSAAAQDSAAAAVDETGSEAEAVLGMGTPPAEQEEKNATMQPIPAADPGTAAGQEAVLTESHSEIPAAKETAPVAAEQAPLVEAAFEPENGPREECVALAIPTPHPANGKWDMGRGFFPSATGGSMTKEQGNGNHAQEIRQAEENSAETPEEGAPLASPAPESGTLLLEQFQAAVHRPDATERDTLDSVRKALAELQETKQKFEAEIRDRLDAAIADYQRRLSSEALANDAAGQFEERTKRTTDKIFREVKEQAWVMLNAVSGELRSFRDQFGKEVRERVDMLDQTTQQALQVREGLEEALPQAKDVLQSLPLAGEEAAARVQAASAEFAEQLQSSRATLSMEIAAQREALKALLHDCHQDELRLKEEIEKFRTEADAACDLIGRKADESLERISTGTEAADAHVRECLENVAGEIEQRMLSGDLIEKATGRVGQAVQEVVEPALERIRSAGTEADSKADSLTRTGQGVVDRLGMARQEIEARLGALVGEQRNLLESSVNQFHLKAAEELGNVVERVVAQSSQQLDERLRSLFDDLISSTSAQINSTARTTLSSLHDGLKGVFEPEDAEGVTTSVVFSHKD